MIRFAAAAALALSTSACVSTSDKLVRDMPEAAKHRKEIAADFQKSFGHHLILGDLPFRHTQIAGPYAEQGITGGTIYNYCVSAAYELGPFKLPKVAYGRVTVTQQGDAIRVLMYATNGFMCQGQDAKPFVELAEIVAAKTGVSVETVLNGDKAKL